MGKAALVVSVSTVIDVLVVLRRSVVADGIRSKEVEEAHDGVGVRGCRTINEKICGL